MTVKQGQAGISYNSGALVVLSTGRHVLPAATQLFAGFIALGQQVLKISEVRFIAYWLLARHTG